MYNLDLHKTVFSLHPSSPNIVRVIKSRKLRWAGHVARVEEGRSVFKILTCKSTGKRPLGRPGHKWEEGIRMNHEEIVK